MKTNILVCVSLMLLALTACTVPNEFKTTLNVRAVAAQAATTATAVATATVVPTPIVATNGIPLKDALKTLEPQDVFTNFYNITQVPRPSGHMDQIRAFLMDFGKGLGLETMVDDAGNVLIRKPASAGMENRETVVLQAHMDMVAQKAEGKDFDFTTDPIEAYVVGDYLVTDGTTLGADDGIGMAIILSVLQSKTLKTGSIEALFTADEETTMSGALGLKPDELAGRTYINLDWETEGSFAIGSAGGAHVNVNSPYKQMPAPKNAVSYQVKVSGLQGGHSGMDINKGRGHATKILVRLLKQSLEPYGLQIAGIEGGTASNAIPTTASAIVFLDEKNIDAFTKFVADFQTTVQTELKATEPNLKVELFAVQPPAQVPDETFQTTVIDALYGTPQGVLRMSDAITGLVETSTNLGITNVQTGTMQIVSYPRSSVDSELDDAAQMIASVWELAGYQSEETDRFSGWNPNPDSPILKQMQSTYKTLFGVDATTEAIHAGLECGAVGGTYPGMDMISIGPTLENVHSTSERLYIPSVDKVMKLLTTVLQQIPEAQK